MRFLHTSDWHLGRIFHGLRLLEDQAAVLQQVLSIAKEYNVDALVVAGDIYDRAVPPTEAVSLLNEVLGQLVLQLKIPVILIAGNHDNPDRLNFGQALLRPGNYLLRGLSQPNHILSYWKMRTDRYILHLFPIVSHYKPQSCPEAGKLLMRRPYSGKWKA